MNKHGDEHIALGDLEIYKRHFVFMGIVGLLKLKRWNLILLGWPTVKREVKCDISRSTNGKETCPYDIPIEFWKSMDR